MSNIISSTRNTLSGVLRELEALEVLESDKEGVTWIKKDKLYDYCFQPGDRRERGRHLKKLNLADDEDHLMYICPFHWDFDVLWFLQLPYVLFEQCLSITVYIHYRGQTYQRVYGIDGNVVHLNIPFFYLKQFGVVKVDEIEIRFEEPIKKKYRKLLVELCGVRWTKEEKASRLDDMPKSVKEYLDENFGSTNIKVI